MTEEALRGWYWAGVIVFALAVLVGWYMQWVVVWTGRTAGLTRELSPATEFVFREAVHGSTDFRRRAFWHAADFRSPKPPIKILHAKCWKTAWPRWQPGAGLVRRWWVWGRRRCLWRRDLPSLQAGPHGPSADRQGPGAL